MERNKEAYPGRCKECKYCEEILATGNWSFYGCRHKPYKGKWVVEIKDCPKEKASQSRCKHCWENITKNEIGEEGCYCELYDHWRNITLGDCIGNCESEEE